MFRGWWQGLPATNQIDAPLYLDRERVLSYAAF